MKKIRRTITMRKVEFISSNKNDHEINLEVCPLCNSRIRVLPPAKDSAVENLSAESSPQLPGKKEIERK